MLSASVHRQHQTVDALAQQLFHHNAFALAAVVGGCQQQAVAAQTGRSLHGLQLLGEDRVEQIGHHHADQVGGLQAQLAAEQVGPKTQFTGSGEHLFAGRRAYLVGRGKGAGSGRTGDPGQPCNVFQISHGHSLEIDLIGEDISGAMWQERGGQMTV